MMGPSGKRMTRHTVSNPISLDFSPPVSPFDEWDSIESFFAFAFSRRGFSEIPHSEFKEPRFQPPDQHLQSL